MDQKRIGQLSAHGSEPPPVKLQPIDGQASIEHQIDVHVLDLTECRDSIPEILQGLKYCMDYRIRGGKLPHLDRDLMNRLLSALLPLLGKQSGNLLKHRPSPEADLAFQLFGYFLEEVEEFRQAVARKSATDLCEALKLHHRCQSWSTKEQQEDAAGVLSLLLRYFPKSFTWKELVKADEHADVEKLMAAYPAKFAEAQGGMITADQTILYPPPALYFDKAPDRLADMFGTSMIKGLTQTDVEKFWGHYGENTLPSPPKRSQLKMIWAQLTDFMIIILFAAAITETCIGEVRSAVILFAVIVMNAIIGFTQELKASKALEALMTLSIPKASVIRDGVVTETEASVLVPGDVVVLEEGDAVPADLRLFEVSQLEIVESILTGESIPTSKSTETIRKRTRRLPLADCKGSAFMATVVAKGRGKGIVVRTGVHTEIGKISMAIALSPQTPTNIQRKLDRLGKALVGVSLLLCAIIVVIGLAYKNDAMEVVLVGISLAVSVIPEGLVAVVTVTMAIGVRYMARRNAIVRQLASVETLGSVSVICSDKTGTLTEGKMGCAEMWTASGDIFTYTDSTSLDPSRGKVQTRGLDQAAVRDISREFNAAPAQLVAATMVSTLCNNSTVTKNAYGDDYLTVGDPTEIAMVVASQKAGFSREFFHDNLKLHRVNEFAFDSDRKLMSVVYTQKLDQAGLEYQLSPNIAYIFCKGAPEGVLMRSTSYLPSNASMDFVSMMNCAPTPLTDEFVELVSNQSEVMAKRGLRVLALAMRKITEDAVNGLKTPASAETALTFVGLIGLIDPARAGVADSVESCVRAGIRVIMITGDHAATAVAIAQQLGIYNPLDPSRARHMTGHEIDSLSGATLTDLNPFPVVFARVSPDNKLKIVEALQQQGHSVAMTGDGVNDAPAIKRADVGIAMGIGGTEITKQAADIVLADDNFSSIVEAVREGRRVFDNIQKFCVYLLSCNSAEIFLFLAAAIINIPMPFSTIQILWANIIADVPPAMSLGLEPHGFDIMQRPPRPQTEGVLTVLTSVIIVLQGIVLSAISLIVYLLSISGTIPNYSDITDQQTLTFLVLTAMQILQSFLSRSVQNSVFVVGLTGNVWLIVAFVFSFGMLVAGIYLPGLSDWLEFKSVDYVGWIVLGICFIVHLILIELIKFGARILQRGKPDDMKNQYRSNPSNQLAQIV